MGRRSWCVLSGRWFSANYRLGCLSKTEVLRNLPGTDGICRLLSPALSRPDLRIRQPAGFHHRWKHCGECRVYKIPSQLGPIVSIKSVLLTTTSNEEVLLVGCKKGVALISGLDATSFRRDIVTKNSES